MARSVFDRPSIKRALDYGQAWDSYRQEHSLKHQQCICGSKENLQRHHIIKASRAKSHAPAFIEILCQECHRKKHRHMRKR